MLKILSILLIGLFSISSAQSELKWSGYLENTAVTIYDDDSLLLTNNTTLRLESKYETTNSKVEAAIVYSKQFSPIDPRMNLREGSVMEKMYYDLYELSMRNIDDTIRTQIDDFLKQNSGTLMFLISNMPYSTMYPIDKIIIDRGSLSLYSKYITATFGVQQIAWGTGYAFNPTDLWNTKNPSDPNASKRGIPAIRAEFSLGKLSGLDFVLAPSTDLKTSSAGLRFTSNIFNFDYSLSLSRYLGADRAIMLLPEKVVAGIDFSGDIIDGIGIWGEMAASNPKYSGFHYYNTDSAYVQFDLGLTYTFENGITFLAEYYYNGLGESNFENYNLTGFMYMMSGDMVGLGKHYLMPGIQYTIFDDFQLSLFTLINVGDKSQMLLPQIDYFFNEDFSLNLIGTFGLGDRYKSEYGSINNSGALKVIGWF